ncbi:LysR family transcriptional regulator [Affinibrenneria salicis]|uniref:LysR family transcriptional regulator n=1 Tax=Affinibrenneria salicis TaxID=2590031 RepID=A0A5J5FYR0_9GAMM|nr:LysR family transcriptional regulator [Affinibrenneria salicis]KAA8999358.1 LysR family transcriptional regulator [Affinibrenneria salicis]
MDTGLIKAFIMLAEAGSYHEAAARLFITQSALTKKINRLEQQSGLTLFSRGRTGARLTAAGQYLLNSARRFMSEEKAFLDRVQFASAGHIGHLNIGFGLSSLRLAPDLISRFKTEHPGISINLNDMASAQQKERLLNGTLSVGFLRLPVSAPLTALPLISDNLVLAVNKDLFVDQPVDFILRNAPFLRMSDVRCSSLNRRVLLYLEQKKLHINISQQADDILTLLALAAAGTGVSILPESCVYLGMENIRTLPLPETRWQSGIAWNPEEADPVRDLFIATCRRHAPPQPAEAVS